MHTTKDIVHRKPIWIALSEFYLDTELGPLSYGSIAKKCIDSPYSLDEIIEIDKNEVFPVLFLNMLSVAGVWSGFDEEWLLKEIAKNNKKQHIFRTLRYKLIYRNMRWMFKESWSQLTTEIERQRVAVAFEKRKE